MMEPDISRFRSRSSPMRKPSRAATSSDQMAVVEPYPGKAMSMTGHCNPVRSVRQGRAGAAPLASALYLYTLWGFAYPDGPDTVLDWGRLRPTADQTHCPAVGCPVPAQSNQEVLNDQGSTAFPAVQRQADTAAFRKRRVDRTVRAEPRRRPAPPLLVRPAQGPHPRRASDDAPFPGRHHVHRPEQRTRRRPDRHRAFLQTRL